MYNVEKRCENVAALGLYFALPVTFKVICSILMKGKTAKGGKISTNINVF